MSEDEARPSPEALLRQAAREERGRLKIYLGAAPGVGKTYEMLSDAAERQRGGADVVVGVVETHGRAETEALVAPFEVIPRRSIPYRGQTLTEMDLDAILARQPQIALVDELAHTNAPGSRHLKRWQDIEELVAAGIDVMTTVNIQHLESLNDVVGSFTRIRVRESVPDRVFEGAEIEVVDLPPDDLIARLRAGKVYVPEEAGRALENFFSLPNLSALRELALRRAAQAVDQQMLDHLRASAAAGSWAAGERVLVAVSEEPGALAVVRAAKRLADALHAPLTAVHVETPRSSTFDEARRRRLGDALALASELGATLVSVPAPSVQDGLRGQIREVRATQLVIGKSQRSRLFELRNGSVVRDLLATTHGVAIHVIPIGAEREGGQRARPAGLLRPGPRRGYLQGLALVALTAAAAKLAEPWLGYAGLDLLFLVPVIGTAARFGMGPGLVAAVAAGLAYNFFFLPPIRTLSVYDPRNAVTVVMLVAVGLVTSRLAARVRDAAALSAKSARENAALARFAARLGALSDAEGTARAVCAEVGGILGVRTAMIGGGDDGVRIVASEPEGAALGPTDRAAAQWALERGEATGAGTGTLTGSPWQFRPLTTAMGTLAVLGLRHPTGGHPIPPERAGLAASLIDQAALAHERLALEAETRDLRATRERDSLRTALLTSLGHDLRTPLTAVTAAAEALGPAGNDPALVETIRSEARRLDRFLGDLLEVVRIEDGAVAPALEPVDLTDVVSGVLRDLAGPLAGRDVAVDVAPDLPLVRADPVLLQHALLNLVDNAAKYSAEGAPIEIRAHDRGRSLVLSVRDHGAGLPSGAERTIFERFRRGQVSDRTGGAGLGLAIVQGFAAAMGFAVRAANAPGGGARFAIAFPAEAILRGAADGGASALRPETPADAPA